MLASMRLCSNTPGQLAIQTALGGYQSIDDLVAPGGRLARQRDLAHSLLTAIPGVTCVKPKAALYMFPKLDPTIYPIDDDQQFAYELLAEQKVLIVQGTGFNWPTPGPPARRLPAELRRPGRGDGPDRDLPRALPGAARGEVGQPAFLRMKPFQVGLLGAGVVGGGTFAVLQRNQEEIRRRAGREIRIAPRRRRRPGARPPRRRRRRRGRQRRARADREARDRRRDRADRRHRDRPHAGPRGDRRRQARRHRQQGAARGARHRDLRGGARERRRRRLRGGGRRRHPDHQGAARRADREPDRVDRRDHQRHDQLHPLGDAREADRLREPRSPRRSGSATPRPTRPSTSPASTPPTRRRS